MQSVREDIEKEHHSIQSSDIVIFFQVARFVTSFQYQKLLILKVRNLGLHISSFGSHIKSNIQAE